MRLRDLFTGGMTWRELAAYVEGFPPQSRTRTALNGGIVEPSHEEVLLADLFDAVSDLDYHFCTANADEKNAKKIKPRKPYPRRWLKRVDEDKGEKRVTKLEDARRRRRERQQAIAQGLIV
ncbi:hypothetical protein ACFQ6Q_00845 [Streptomyces sp. NPDC056437]|uniref:hypothetical protein n=1 Tax=Streptomyces sp. NPDC056437 TaxID=3345816 RepID=UPI003693EAEF